MMMRMREGNLQRFVAFIALGLAVICAFIGITVWFGLGHEEPLVVNEGVRIQFEPELRQSKGKIQEKATTATTPKLIATVQTTSIPVREEEEEVRTQAPEDEHVYKESVPTTEHSDQLSTIEDMLRALNEPPISEPALNKDYESQFAEFEKDAEGAFETEVDQSKQETVKYLDEYSGGEEELEPRNHFAREPSPLYPQPIPETPYSPEYMIPLPGFNLQNSTTVEESVPVVVLPDRENTQRRLITIPNVPGQGVEGMYDDEEVTFLQHPQQDLYLGNPEVDQMAEYNDYPYQPHYQDPSLPFQPEEAADYQANTYDDPPATDTPLSSFIQDRLNDVYNWIYYGFTSSDNSTEIKDVLAAMNTSIQEGNTTILLQKVRQLYANPKFNPLTSSALGTLASTVTNSTYFALAFLSFDLLLLHNMQQIVSEEQRSAYGDRSDENIMNDPEVLALNALFLPPEEVQEYQEYKTRQLLPPEEETTMAEDLLQFVNNALRALMSVGKAYRRDKHMLDCIWTLYCRNLDKVARLDGAYGFVAKMNSLGLRLIMREFPVESTFDVMIREATEGWGRLNCPKLFPRCEVDEAVQTILKASQRSSDE